MVNINSMFPYKRFKFKSEKIFEDLSDECKGLILREKTTLKIPKGQSLFYEGMIPQGVFLLKKGKVKKFTTGLEGKMYIFQISIKNELIGYQALMSKASYPYSASSLTDCEIDFIPKSTFMKLIDLDKLFGYRLLEVMAHEFGVFVNNMKILSQHSVRERVALSLIELNECFSDINEGIKISRRDHSSMIGTSVESLTRVLHDFKEERIIKVEKGEIFVNDMKKLIKVSNYV
ncbi:Crp/Fnr family transcriptional regulator [Tenacibaculum sp. TC6]|uniref:Crp/Fnr family transcriptional regulator n=1 Tax=Tenacibaculum sp. TC6 TaxID=3423223 RepID=UPI003D366742